MSSSLLLRAHAAMDPDQRIALERWQLEQVRVRCCHPVVQLPTGADLLFALELSTIASLYRESLRSEVGGC